MKEEKISLFPRWAIIISLLCGAFNFGITLGIAYDIAEISELVTDKEAFYETMPHWKLVISGVMGIFSFSAGMMFLFAAIIIGAKKILKTYSKLLQSYKFK